MAEIPEGLQEVFDEVNGVEPSEETKPTEEPVAESPSSEGEPESVSPEPVDESAISDEMASTAREYGLNPEFFETPEQLEQQMLSMDRLAAQQARQAYQGQQQQQQAQQQPQVDPQQQQEPASPFQLDLDPAAYPEGMVDTFNGVLKQIHDQYNPLMQEVEQLRGHLQQQHEQQAQQQQMQVVQDFETAVGGLGHASLFGADDGSRTQGQVQNMQALYAEADALAAGYYHRGMAVPPMAQLVAKAEQLVFGEQLKNFNARTANARMKKQAKQKLGSGNRGATPTGDWQGDPEDNPVLKQKWKELQEGRSER